MKKSKLKYVCNSFASNISTEFICDNDNLYKIFGASGLLGYYKFKTMSKEYLGIVKDGAGVGRISVYPKDSSLLGTMSYIIPKKNINMHWLKYCIMSLNLNESLDKTTIPHIYFSEYGNKEICIPNSLHEQKLIAEFLDKKCEEIDGITKALQEQIETLENYKKSVITEAVTKGLNPDVKMKDSNLKWMPKIPNNWKTEKGKYCFASRNSKGNKNKLELLSPTQKYGVIPQGLYEQLSTQVTVKTNEKTNLMSFKTIHKGDYCISLRSFEGGFEYSNYEGVVSPAYTVLYPIISVDRRYYKYLFKISTFIYEMNSYSLSLRDGKPISYENFGNTFLPIPPFQEQKEIANYLDTKCAEINDIIKNKKEQLETLEEYKKSLIYEYVTGKKEVKNA